VHVPDGFIDAPVSIGAGVVAAAAIGVALRGSRRELGDEKVAPLAGLVAAFVFAVQMLNFPVASGTSGHLLGGALAAVLVGPWTGLLCVAVVLLVQLFFADGGLTAYGVNVTCMAVTTALVGWLVFTLVLRLLPRRPRSVVPASFVAALVSVPVASLVFTGIYALGGTADIPIGRLAAAMIGVHVLIGIGEAVITALVVSSVLAVRPDLVYGARTLVSERRAQAVAA
jgi:cobalt/nickel transport system permease protein